MRDSDLRAIARRIAELMIRERPAESAIVAAMVLSEIMAVGLFGDDNEPEAVDEFAAAVNVKLAEIALHLGADRGWELLPCAKPRRH